MDSYPHASSPMALLSDSAFWVPDRFVESAWVAHAPFAFWLIEALRPRSLVELGTHNGFSYLVFCQAVDRLSTGTRCYAVDHWEGDDHTGFYSEDVYEQLRSYHDARYTSFSELIRSSFTEAARHFTDASVDLLHIDGAHRIDDVQADFDTWLPKVSDRGIMLFHDINVHRDDFGVHELWETVRASYPHFEFDHGHGLGVLGCGPDAEKTLGGLFQLTNDAEAAVMVRRAFSRLGEALVDKADLHVASATAASAQKELSRVGGELSRVGDAGEALRVEVLDARATIASLEARAADLQAERDDAVSATDAILASTSWRTTAPARALARTVRRILRR